MSVASLLFARGDRPDPAAIADLAGRGGEFSISFDPAMGGGSTEQLSLNTGEAGSAIWLELLANGLTFDLAGLKPGPPSATPGKRHSYGLSSAAKTFELEAITLQPGPHLAGGEALLPIVRSLAGLAAQLAGLRGVQAIAWHAAGCWSAPQQFRGSVQNWIEGGPFPMFSLAALKPVPEGGFVSEGLALFTGQELRLEQEPGAESASQQKTALRLAHWLVEHGRLAHPETIVAPNGDALRLIPSADYQLVNVEKV